MKKLFAVLFLAMAVAVLSFAQQKFALVIGNSNYTGISKLNNPLNDANDMEAALKSLGFTVEKVLDGNLEQMENAIINLKRKLGVSQSSYGFFFYAGHGVQAGGENYLIPVAANNIRSESQLRDRAVSLQFVLDSLNEAENELNMVVLDACRDNPFGWNRSGSRGLSMVNRAPSGSIVMYAAGAGQAASDGNDRNGLFTAHLLRNLKTPGLSVYEVFANTMGDVKKDSDGMQDPELSLKFSGAHLAYLGSRPSSLPAPGMVSTAQTHYERGKVFFDRGDWDTAILEFTEAIRLDPGDAIVYNNRGAAYDNKGDYDHAISDYTQAIRLDPNDSVFYNNRGAAYYDKGDYDRAIADLTQAIRLEPDNAVIYFNRGSAYKAKRDTTRANADYAKAKELGYDQ